MAAYLVVDTLINDAVDMGLRCRIFDVDHYIGWGTPDDLHCFEYWQSCFDKWFGHPYTLQLDTRVSSAALPSLRDRFRKRQPALPASQWSLANA